MMEQGSCSLSEPSQLIPGMTDPLNARLTEISTRCGLTMEILVFHKRRSFT